MPRLWTPGRSKEKVEVDVKSVMKPPSTRKAEGGSYFDDELETVAGCREVVQLSPCSGKTSVRVRWRRAAAAGCYADMDANRDAHLLYRRPELVILRGYVRSG